MITMNKTVMILRVGEMGSLIIMMMKVMIIAAIYLSRADVVAQSWPLCSTLTVANYLSLKHVHVLYACSHKHCLQFIHWLAAIARHSSRQLAADARELLTITPTAPPPAPLPVSSSLCQAAPLSHKDTTSPPNRCSPSMSFHKTYNPFCLPVGTFSYTSTGCPFATSTHTQTHLIDRCDEKELIAPSVGLQDVIVLQFSNRLRPSLLTGCNSSLFSTGTGSCVISGCQGKSPFSYR